MTSIRSLSNCTRKCIAWAPLVLNMFVERDEEISVPGDLVRKRFEEVENPRNGRETNREVEAPDMFADTGIQENRNGDNEGRERMSEKMENPRTGETPPDDDCCSICFEDFDIPCKTNCGHWFCAKCILTLWNYGRALHRCKCPICTLPISKLTPEASLTLQREEEVVGALKKVQRYNRLYVGGARGLMMKVHELPLLFRRCFGGMIDPNRLRINYYTARLVAALLAICYEFCQFDFIPTGKLGAIRVFQFCAVALVVVLFVVGLIHRLILNLCVRRLAALRL